MDLITKAIQDIKFSIPREILRMAYLEDRFAQYSQAPVSLDKAIRDKTIIPRVVVDTDIVGGQTIIVSLAGISPKVIDEHNYLFEIPPERVDYRTIMSVLSVSYFRNNSMPGYQFNAAAGVSPSTGGALALSAQRAMNSRENIPIISTAECQVVGHNVVLVRNHLRTAAMTEIRCRVENDENLANMPLTVAPVFSKLCRFAAKAFIYNELIVKLDRGRIDRGHEIGAVKSIIESYADANENYELCRDEEWGAVSIMADRLTYEDLLRLQMDPSA